VYEPTCTVLRNKVVMALVVKDEHVIQPQALTPAIDSSDWPLLLKNYTNCIAYDPCIATYTLN